MRRFLRLTVAVVILALLVHRLGAGNVARHLATADFRWVAAALGLLFVSTFLRVFNWLQLARGLTLDHRPTFGVLLRCYLAGGFLGSFIPSTVGTDAVRSILIRRRLGGALTDHAASILVLNLLGLFAGCAVGVLGTAGLWLTTGDVPPILRATAAVAGAVLAGGIALYATFSWSRRLRVSWTRRLRGPLLKPRKIIRRFFRYLETFTGADAVSVGRVFAVSCASQLMRAASLSALGISFGIGFAWLHWPAIVPLPIVVQLLPLSVMGFGADQAALTYALTTLGALAPAAFSVSILHPCLYIVLNVLGACVVLADDRPPRADPSARALE